MSLELLKLARRRLRLGIANVGLWVVTSSGGLWWLTSGGAHVLDTLACVIIGLAAIVEQAAFDVIGGAWLMPPPRPAPGNIPASLVARRNLSLLGVGTIRLDLQQTTALREKLELSARETNALFILIGKDGGEKARQRGTLKLASWFTLIEGMPMRRDEIRRQKKSRE